MSNKNENHTLYICINFSIIVLSLIMGYLGYLGAKKYSPESNEILYLLAGLLTFMLIGIWSVLIRKIILKED